MQGTRKVGFATALWMGIFLCGAAADSSYYSTYYGAVLTSSDVQTYTSNGTVANCTILVAACNASEPRRIDGTCNNLNYPSSGAPRSPYYRLLPAVYNQTSSTVFDPRLSVCGGSLRSPRKIRTSLLADGNIPDTRFTHSMTHFCVYYVTDITNTRDTSNYAFWRPYCCEEKGKTDPQCAAHPIPEDDYVHRFTGKRCLNMTRPFSYQTSGCLPNTTTPLRIVDTTLFFDMSPIYGSSINNASDRRTFSGGKLAVETVDEREFPKTTGSLLLGINFIGIVFFWRYHNYLCTELLKVNPNLTDDEAFSLAREINIASGCQILYYELMPQLMGEDNLIADGIISNSTGFRDVYDETVKPGLSMEFTVAFRWMHKMQDGDLKYYSSNGTYLNQSYPMVNLTSNINVIKQNKTMDYVTQGCFRQASGKVDDQIVHPDLLNLGLGGLQSTNDIVSNDLAKNRYFGMQPYVKYRELCFGDNITSFDDLEGIVDSEIIAILKELYCDVADIDLGAGLWSEKIMTGSYVPPTFYCIISKELLHNIQSDRHWYEREDRPNAFTEEQLAEIRKVTIARVLCDTGDGVTEIQPSAFLLAGDDNEVVSCDDIPAMDFSVWAPSSSETTTDCPTTTESDYYYDSTS